MDFVILFNIEGSPIQCGAYFIFLPPRKMTNWVWALPLLLMSVMNRAINLSVLSWPEIFLRKYFNICLLDGGIFSVVCDFISTWSDGVTIWWYESWQKFSNVIVSKQSIDNWYWLFIYNLHIRLVLCCRKPLLSTFVVGLFKRGLSEISSIFQRLNVFVDFFLK